MERKKEMDNMVAAIVVTYNRKNMLLECIDHIKKQSISCDIIVIDNASTDGTKDELSEHIADKSIIYFNTGKNVGGAGGFQFGLKKAYELGYKYFWLMDDDTYVNEDALKGLLDTDSKLHGNYGFLSSVAYWKDGSLCKMNRQHINLRHRVTQVPEKEIELLMASFVSFFTKRDIIEDIGLPIKEFFIWADDLEYSRRISKKYPCYLVPQSTVVHYMNNNDRVGIDIDAIDRLWRYSYLYRNEVYVYRREGIKGRFFLFARIILHSVRVLLSNVSEKRKRLGVICSSAKAGFKFNPTIERVRDK